MSSQNGYQNFFRRLQITLRLSRTTLELPQTPLRLLKHLYDCLKSHFLWGSLKHEWDCLIYLWIYLDTFEAALTPLRLPPTKLKFPHTPLRLPQMYNRPSQMTLRLSHYQPQFLLPILSTNYKFFAILSTSYPPFLI